jgi:uncharacterized membrane protein
VNPDNKNVAPKGSSSEVGTVITAFLSFVVVMIGSISDPVAASMAMGLVNFVAQVIGMLFGVKLLVDKDKAAQEMAGSGGATLLVSAVYGMMADSGADMSGLDTPALVILFQGFVTELTKGMTKTFDDQSKKGKIIIKKRK